MPKVNISEVHKMLMDLVANLGTKNLEGLIKPPLASGSTQTPEEWEAALKTAVKELEDWCLPNSVGEPFTIDVPLKR
jgi:hypothetical protein